MLQLNTGKNVFVPGVNTLYSILIMCSCLMINWIGKSMDVSSIIVLELSTNINNLSDLEITNQLDMFVKETFIACNARVT